MSEQVTSGVHAARMFRPVMADGSDSLPGRIEVIKAGTWPMESNKGALTITIEDLHQFVANFDSGVGMPAGMHQLPIDFSHNDFDKAAGWMKALYVIGDTLYADVEWSTAGIAALEGKEYKLFSPSFYPACLGEWRDPENHSQTARNVLCGGALTNIPFFKGLTPIMASNASENAVEGRNTIHIQASDTKGTAMTLADVLAKDKATLTDEDKSILVDANNKNELDATQQAAYGFEVTAVQADNKDDKEPTVPAPVVDANNKIDAAAFTALQTEVENLKKVTASQATAISAYERKEAEAFVAAHVERGAIKADAVDQWVDKVVADSSIKQLMNSMSGNGIMADAQGTSTNAEDVQPATQKIDAMAKAAIDEAKAKGETLDYGTATSRILASNADLAKEYYSGETNQ